MTDIATIPLAVLREDYAAAKLDLKLCEKLLVLMPYDDNRRDEYVHRVEGNRKHIEVIEAEIDIRADESSRERDDV